MKKSRRQKGIILFIAIMVILILSPFVFSTISEDAKYTKQVGINDWAHKPGYTNSTYGPPDFSQLQDGWWNLFDLNYVYCGPVALLDCLWWLDAKIGNTTQNYFLPDFTGVGSKNSSNVLPLVNWTANFTSTTLQWAADDRSGTSSINMTKGIYEIINYTNMSDTFQLTTEGMVDEGIWVEFVNYTNITDNLSRCNDVILLLGFYCYDGLGFSNRYGGHYVQVNGYNTTTPGLSFSDPFFDRAEDGALGWNSTHTHPPEPFSNSSHNWTTNVSYDYYYINDSSAFDVLACEVINYTNNESNWTGQNWMNSSYEAESACWQMIDGGLRTVIEQAWYIELLPNLEINKSIWDDPSWVPYYPDATVGETLIFNISVHNAGATVTENLTVWETYWDALAFYVPGTSWVLYPNGTRTQQEPNWTSWENGTCSIAGHGHLGWYFDAYQLANFSYCDYMYIEFNMTVNGTNSSRNEAICAECLNSSFSATECLYNYKSIDDATVFVNREFNTSIGCLLNLTENSTWILSEHVNRGMFGTECLDEVWFEYETNFSRWMAYNTSGFEDENWEWTYRYDNLDSMGLDELGLSYTIANNTNTNRSQSILRMRYNVTNWGEGEDGDPYIGVIYSFTNNSSYDMALYSWNSVLLLSKNATGLSNTNDSSAVNGLADAYDYWDASWSCNDSVTPNNLNPTNQWDGGEGIWTKTLYSELTDHLQVKAWNITGDQPWGLCFEPSGWIYDDYTDIELLEDYPSMWRNDALNIMYNHPSALDVSAVGQSFTTPMDQRYELYSAVFSIRKTGTPDGNMYAALYEIQDCGGSATAVGDPLAISSPIACAEISAVTWVNYTFYFMGNESILMNDTHTYGIVAFMGDNTNGDGATHFTEIGDDDAGAAAGNEFYYAAGWDCYPLYDIIFEVYGKLPDTVNSSCFGLVTWSPYYGNNMTYYADFDFIEEWKLNYSRDEQNRDNVSEQENHSVFGTDGIPFLYFPTFNVSDWLDEYDYWYNESFIPYNNSNISAQTFADSTAITYRNISALFNQESRMHSPYQECGSPYRMDNQNDTIYYSTAIATNITGEPYQSAMLIQIDVPTDGYANWGDGAVVLIDVDHDYNWSGNDLAFIWYDSWGDNTSYIIYNGSDTWSSGVSGATATQARFWADWDACPYTWNQIELGLPALHRYSGHRVYKAIIPTYYFQQSPIGSGNFLNVNETFGIHIMTVDAGVDGVPPGDSVPVWEDWNEQTEDSYTFLTNATEVWETYLNLSTFDEIEQFYLWCNWTAAINSSQMGLWGNGRYGNETGTLDMEFWNLNITKTANVSAIVNTTKDNLINYTFTICNTGDFPIHNVTINDTFPTGVVYVSANISATSVYEKVSGTWHFNITEPINASNCSTFDVQVNFTGNMSLNGSYVNNFANVSCDEVNSTYFTNVSVQYGENSPPQLNWTYPAQGNTGISVTPTGLANLSAYFYDADGDAMYVYFGTNKSSSWTPTWYDLGSNITEGEGHNYSNQTFNVSQRYNTQWRWGLTTYYWHVNITDGKIWTNTTLTYTTGTSRYDVSGSGDVISGDVSATWANRQGVRTYLGIYDVDASGDIVSGDLSDIWANRT